MYLISYYTLWKHQKSWDFLMFSVGIEKDQWYQMGNLWTFIVFVEAWIATKLTMRFSSEHKKSHYRLTASLFSNSIVFSHSVKTKRACLLKWAKIYWVYRCPHTIHFSQKQKQPSTGVLKKTCSENMQWISGEHPWRSVISIKLQSNFMEITLSHGCSPVNLPHIFRTPFPRNTSRRLLLKITLWLTDILRHPQLKVSSYLNKILKIYNLFSCDNIYSFS